MMELGFAGRGLFLALPTERQRIELLLVPTRLKSRELELASGVQMTFIDPSAEDAHRASDSTGLPAAAFHARSEPSCYA